MQPLVHSPWAKQDLNSRHKVLTDYAAKYRPYRPHRPEPHRYAEFVRAVLAVITDRRWVIIARL
jgi:hypothetical protein